MKITRNIIIGIFILISSTAIKAQDSTFHSSKSDTTAFIQIIQDPNIEIINKYYKEITSADSTILGYRIQIYFGNRNKANYKVSKFTELFPDTAAKIIYEEPNFKTVVGEYQTKIEADRELVRFQEDFPSAFIIRNKVTKK